jgi:hypothetical protein
MKRKGWQRLATLLSLLLLAGMLASVAGTAAAPTRQPDAPVDYNVTTPRAFFGYDLGQDYKLTPWQTRELQNEGLRKGIVDYAQELARTSNRVHFMQYGVSEEGRPMILSVITSPENWAQIDNLKGILAKLADPRQVASDEEAKFLASQGKAVYWITAAIHASERTSPEVLMRLAYHLASNNDPATMKILDNLIVVLDHTVNPDGLDMVTDWYYKYKDTPYVSSSPPYYNHYINHDNNRDYLGLGAKESQQNAAVRTPWHPTVFHDLHEAMQMLYITPGPDPSNEAISGITMAEWLGYAGYTMTGLITKGYKGVFTYDYASMWYPGFMNSFTSEYNSYAMFYELQGAYGATPRTITQAGRGRAWYNPAPYTPGFTWRLMDAVNMEEDALMLSLGYTVKNKNELLYNFYLKGRNSYQKASTEPPYAYVIPQNGGDNADVTDMINNLRDHLFDIGRASVPFTVNGRQFRAGDFVIRTDQPYGVLLKNLLDVQNYPKEFLPPFDVTAWTYGMMRDVETVSVTTTVLSSLSTVPVTTTVPYVGSLSGDVSSRYVIEHQSNNNLAKVLPQLWQDADMKVYQPNAAFWAGGQTYPVGTFVVATKGTSADHAKLQALAQHYGLAIHAASDAPSGIQLRQPRVGLYTPNSTTSNTMPEGWVRMLMDRDAFPYTRLYPADVVSGTLASFDVIVIPDVSVSALINGSSSQTLPPEYRLGIGASGVANLKSFVQGGGTLVAMGRASAMPIQQGWNIGVSIPTGLQAALAADAAKPEPSNEELDFPALQAQPAAPTAAMSCQGTILKLQVDPSTPVGYGYNTDEAVWCDTSTTYYTPTVGSQAKIVARYPDAPLLLSGYVSGDDLARGKPAIVDAPLGAGNVVLLGPNTLYRAQATGTYMFYWNALIEAGQQIVSRTYMPYMPVISKAAPGGER